MKKIISAIICVSILLLSIIPTYAAEASDSTGLNCKVVDTDTISNEMVKIYSYNIDATCMAYFELENLDTRRTQRIWFKDCVEQPYSVDVGSYLYKPWIGVSLDNSGSSGGGGVFRYNNIAAKYEKVRFKLSDYSSYFNTDGTVTKDVEDYGEHKYNFTEQVVSSEAKFSSTLVFESGGAITCAVPDKNGYVEVYISKAINCDVSFSTVFHHYITPVSGGLSVGSDGGTNREPLRSLITGNVDQNYTVNIDDVTMLQSYLAQRATLDATEKRAADANADNKINIDDVTALQLYLAKR